MLRIGDRAEALVTTCYLCVLNNTYSERSCLPLIIVNKGCKSNYTKKCNKTYAKWLQIIIKYKKFRANRKQGWFETLYGPRRNRLFHNEFRKIVYAGKDVFLIRRENLDVQYFPYIGWDWCLVVLLFSRM